MDFIKNIIVLLCIYLLIGFTLYSMFLVSISIKNKVNLFKVIMNGSLSLNMMSGKKIEGINALMLFLFKWPEIANMVINYIISK